MFVKYGTDTSRLTDFTSQSNHLITLIRLLPGDLVVDSSTWKCNNSSRQSKQVFVCHVAEIMGLAVGRNGFCWSFLVWLCRIWGMLTALGLWGSGSEAVFYKHALGIYLLVAAGIISILELLFVCEYCTDFCLEESKFLKLYEALSLLDDWKKGIFYCLLSVPCFLNPRQVILGVISGVMLAVCSILYMLKTFKTRREEKIKELENKATYDRFEEIHDDLEDSIVNPTAILNMPGIDEQPEILEI